MADRLHQTFRARFKGINTRLPADAMPEGKFPLAINVRADGDSKIKTRPGYNQAFATGGKRATDIRAFTTLETDNAPRLIVHDSSGGVWLDDGVQKGTVGFGGTGASLIPYRPAQSPQSWMYVGNATGYRKFQAPDASNVVLNHKVGIAEPQAPPDAAVDGLQYTDFTAIPNGYTPGGAAASWTAGGDAGAPVYYATPRSSTWDTAGVADTVVAVFQDPASVSPALKLRYSVQLASINNYQIGEALIFNKSGGGYFNAVVEDVFPPMNGGTALTIDQIWYLDSHHCVLVPSQYQFTLESGVMAAIRRGSLIKLGAEVCMIWNVTAGADGSVAIETSTVTQHVNGEALVGIPAIAVAGIDSTVVGQLVSGANINSFITHASGTATLTQVLGSNPFNQILGTFNTLSPNDIIHISLAVSVIANLTEIDLQFDVGDGSFTKHVLAHNVLASAFTIWGTFVEVEFPISALVRTVGDDPNQTLAACTAVQLTIKETGNLNIWFGGLWVGGGGQLDVGTDSPDYLYRVRPRSLITGAIGNPSPATRYGVDPRRQRVIVSLPSASYDPQIDSWDIFRYGGTVPSWRRVGVALSTASTFTDNLSDAGALAGQLLEFDNFEPWPTVDLPWSVTLGVGGVTAMGVKGTVVVIFGPSSAFPVSIMRWLPGTLIGFNGDPVFTLWNRPVPIAGGVLFRLVEDAGSLTITEAQVTEPNVAAQPLPYLWGPDANGVVFGCGDPFRPGVFYSAKQLNPDATPNNVYDLTPPSEPLLGGEVIQGVSLIASTERWWQLQPAFTLPQRWIPVEIPAGRGLASGNNCSTTDGKLVYFWAKDGVYAMNPGAPAVNLTQDDLANLFPHDGVPGQDVTYNGHVIKAPDYKYVSRFRISVINDILRAHYADSTGTQRCLVLDMSKDGDDRPRMAWSYDLYANAIACSYQIEQPPGTLLSINSAYTEGYYADTVGLVHKEQDLANDNGTPFQSVLSTPEWNGGDNRIFKQFLDAMIDIVPAAASQVLAIPTSGGGAVGVNFLFGIPSPTRQPFAVIPLSTLLVGFPIAQFLGLTLQWADDFSVQLAPTAIFGWTAEAVPQPFLVNSWQSVPTSHELEGYHFIYRIRFAYQSYGDTLLTITAFDGTSPAPITLPSTDGAFKKIELVPTFNKGLLFTYQGTATDFAAPHLWAPILDSCEVLVGQWNRQSALSTFRGLGGIESQ